MMKRKHFLMGLIAAGALSIGSVTQAQSDEDFYSYETGWEESSDIEWEPEYGYHEEEWYDPSDWFDMDYGIEYEETWDDDWGYDYGYYEDDSYDYEYYDDDYLYDDYGYYGGDADESATDYEYDYDYGFDEDAFDYGYGYDADADADEDVNWQRIQRQRQQQGQQRRQQMQERQNQRDWRDERGQQMQQRQDRIQQGQDWRDQRRERMQQRQDQRRQQMEQRWNQQSRAQQSQQSREQPAQFQGRITSVRRVIARDGQPESVVLHVRTQDGEERRLLLGDRDYVEKELPALRRNEPVRIAGSMTTIDGRRVFNAKQIRSQGGEFDIPEMQYDQTLQGRLTGARVLRARNGEPQAMIVRVQTEDGKTKSVLLGTQEDLQRGMKLQPNQPVRVRGFTRTVGGRQTFIVQDLHTPNRRQNAQQQRQRQQAEQRSQQRRGSNQSY